MDGLTLEDVVNRFDLRFDRIEQFLPTLATRTELQEGLRSVKDELRSELATKAELQQGLQSVKVELRAELATKADLQEGLQSVKDELRSDLATKAELQAATEKLATKAELQSVRAELRAEIRSGDEATRRYMKVLVEDLSDKINVFAEGLVALDARDARQNREQQAADASLDVRVTALEATRRRPRSR